MRKDINGNRRRANVGTKCAVVLLVALGAIGLATQAFAEERGGGYVAFKGGIYSPSATFNIDNVVIPDNFKGDTKSGFDGEIAFGHFFLPSFALELGAGYFKSKGTFTSPTAASHQMDFNVIPVLVSAKVFIPMGPIDPYGELGVGAYFTKINVSDNLNTFSGNTTFGLHTGAGLNVNIGDAAFIGVEGRYVWANPSFGGQRIRLNADEYSLNGFKLNGFTLTLGLGIFF